MNAASDQAPIARTFAAANPIEFELHNLDDERVLYIVSDDEHLQSLILELRNESPQDICLATPDSGIKPLDGNGAVIAWDEWAAGPNLYHFQLVFRPGVLSDRATFYLAHAAHRVAALDTGWDLHHAQDPGDHTDRISLLWLGKTVAAARADLIRHDPQAWVVDFNEELSVAGEPIVSFAPDALATDSLPKGGVRKFALTRLGAGTGGGGRGTRVHLRYAQLQYANDRGPVPQGSRTLYLNLINHQGRQNIPLHVGFAGSNTILNDGVTPNELELRITNISANDPITFGNHPATCFTVSFDIDDQPWALTRTGEADEIAIEWDGTPKVPLKALDADGKAIAERVFEYSSWLPAVAEQGTRPTWSFSYVGADIRSLAPGQSVSLKLSNIRSSAPSGYTNLYLRYDHIPGYWDGRFSCPIEKGPCVQRGSSVGIGSDLDAFDEAKLPRPKLHVDVTADNAARGDSRQMPAAVFQGGHVVARGNASDAAYIGFDNHDMAVLKKPESWLVGVTGDKKFEVAFHVGTDARPDSSKLSLDASGNLRVEGRIRDKSGQVMPVGSVIAYAGSAGKALGANAFEGPDGWLLCNGGYVQRAQYMELFEVLKDKENIIDVNNPAWFKLPTLSGRHIAGAMASGEYLSGKVGGLASVTLTPDQMPQHAHSGRTAWDGAHKHISQLTNVADNDDNDCAGNYIGDPRNTYRQNTVGQISENGSAHAHNFTTGTEPAKATKAFDNRPPFLALYYIIKY